ncbi:MAG TPA: DegT/DnrJ/EryC1/StrS family aminotransferase [Bacteroidales bacterium]|nr:DegT/DnrJ/EryC1/StrS family aminotransferase [Bacteroidales bacterium]
MPGTELFGEEEKREVMDVLNTGILFRYNHDEQRNGIWKARTFEQELAAYHGVKFAHLTTSGTTADNLALAACGIGVGDEVIVPTFTFIAPVEAVLHAGAIPVFADIDETLCLTVGTIKATLTPRTKAVIVVHMCGSMARIDEITDFCNKNNLILIEDTAQALGASYKGKMLGTFGKVAVYSFDFFKIVSAAEGGAIITNDRAVYDTASQHADHGHTHTGNNRGAEPHNIIGTNYRISELHAAIGLAQFRKLPFILEKQRANKARLEKFLSNYKQVTFRTIPDKSGDSATFLDFFLENEQMTRKLLKEFDKQSVSYAYWYDNNYHYFKNWNHVKQLSTAARLPVTLSKTPQDYSILKTPASDAIMSRLISIQIRIMWTDEEMKVLMDKLDRAFKAAFNN